MKKILIWVQHLLGTGHLKRALSLGQALEARGLEVTVATGGPPAPWLQEGGLETGGLEVVQLRPVRARDLAFSALVDADDRPIDDDFRQRRAAALLQLFEARRPRVVVTEMFPFGRRAFRFELLPLLAAAASATPRAWCVSSVRDILVGKPGPDPYAWMRDLALTHFDRVLVHTDPELVPFGLSFPHAAALGERLISTGYLLDPLPPEAMVTAGPEESREVLVSAGGGRVASRLLEVALAARARSATTRDRPWRLMAGGNRDQAAFRALGADLPAGVVLEPQRADFQVLLAKSLLSISQAGYNTVMEVLRLGKPMVLVPFETASETEQRLRAERLASLGLAETVWERELTPNSLARAIDRALERPAAPPPSIALDGADVSARVIAELAARPWASA